MIASPEARFYLLAYEIGPSAECSWSEIIEPFPSYVAVQLVKDLCGLICPRKHVILVFQFLSRDCLNQFRPSAATNSLSQVL